ncbi:DUF4870 domain-containing protein [uncultured Christiangramia sp.]|uniref:DUF4870 domain-containing protein n=1 Tax=uncultured Christiangramia sp. TaxID=503836 RepID=UPI0026049F19|nr:DUF4870 domain-containing protein [uncultured Christiangramia sp.]
MQDNSAHKNRTLTTVLHLSVFTKYFIPLGNFIFPMLLWLSQKEDAFVDRHGRNALNFQISTFLYTVLLVTIGGATFLYFALKFNLVEPLMTNDSFEVNQFSEALPFIIIMGILGILLLGLFVLEIFAVISASLSANEGKEYCYPLTINFLSSDKPKETNHQNHQSKNEQFNDTQKQTL